MCGSLSILWHCLSLGLLTAHKLIEECHFLKNDMFYLLVPGIINCSCIFKKHVYLFILFLVALGLCCCARFLLVVASGATL